ncbi:acetyltransferase [uncultured Bacteroides sp.]|uniref:acetyltransferase n=1 Tax=uncultured Bacteroides sp. TaxID=162156 RepID=UPI00263144C1|nr:acetyltransferase [uncultured Bacteroides sp.]
MENLVIIGAGGMGRTVYDIAKEGIGYGTTFEIKGFIDDNLSALDGFVGYPSLLGTISDYIPQENDVFTFSIGGEFRKLCIERLLSRNAKFMNLIHRTARIGTNVILGEGNIIGAFTSFGADSKIGNYNMIQSYTVIGHDAQIGDFNRIDTHVTCIGGIQIKNETTIHTSAVINHKVIVEDKAHVGACSFVIRKVKAGTTVFGNPAKKLI